MAGMAQRQNGGARGVRVLVADDEEYITDLLATGLRFVGFDIEVAGDGRQALTKAADFRPDVVLLDVMMPDLDGFEVVRRMRSDGMKTPVIFLTARDATDDKVEGLRLGADDYVTKPFSLEEVVARIEALLRRIDGGPRATSKLSVADLVLDEDAHDVRRANTRIDLSATEFSLLQFLMENAGRVLSKAQILDHVWHYDFGGESNIVETYISYLRKKLDPHGPALIHTVRSVGYVVRPPDGGA
jgi:two-component system OmpR family response regulator